MIQTQKAVDTVSAKNVAERFPEYFGGQKNDPSKVLVVEHLAGDLSSRSYHRLYNSQSNKSYVLQVDRPFKESSAYQTLDFLKTHRFLKTRGLKVPEVYAMHGESGALLLEDLGDHSLQSMPLDGYYHQALEQIFLLNSSPMPKPVTAEFDFFNRSFDQEKLEQEFLHTKKFLLDEYLNMGALSEGFLDLTHELLAEIAQRPHFLMHRDFHSRNLYVRNGDVYVIDFQDLRMGPLSYDLVSLLWDPYVDLEKSFRDELLQNFCKRLESPILSGYSRFDKGSLKDFTNFEIPRVAFQRLIKAAGSFGAFYINTGRSDFLQYIPKALKQSSCLLREIIENDLQNAKLKNLLGIVEHALKLSQKAVSKVDSHG